MSIPGNQGGVAPPSLELRVALQDFHFGLLMPKYRPVGEVAGFGMEDEGFLDQAQVDRAMSALQAFVASAPADDQAVYAALLAQAQGYVDDNWAG